MPMNNPAGRLQELIVRMKAYKKSRGGQGSVYEGWVNVLEYRDNNTSDLHVMRSIALISQLPEEIRKRMVKLGMDQKLYTTWVVPTTQRLKARNLDQPMSTLADFFDDMRMSLIAICDDTLSKQDPEPKVEEEKVNEIRREVEELVKKVQRETGITEQMKDFIIKHLDIVHQACCDYRIVGIAGIQSSVEQSVGHIILNREMAEETSKCDVGVSFYKVLSRLIILSQVYEKFKMIGGDIMALLPESPK